MSNTIVVQLPDSGLVAWKAVSRALLSRGYAIKSSDKDLLTLTSDIKPVKRAGDVVISANVEGRKVFLYGTFNTHVIDETPTRIVFRGMKGSPFMLAWDELQGVAAALGGTATYLTRP